MENKEVKRDLSEASQQEMLLKERKANSAWRKLRRNKSAMFGLILVVFVTLFSLVGPFIYKVDPAAMDFLKVNAKPGTPGLPLGADNLGRDLLARLIHGGRVSLIVAVGGMAVGAVIGILAGLISGYAGGKVDIIIMRVMDGMSAFPFTLLAFNAYDCSWSRNRKRYSFHWYCKCSGICQNGQRTGTCCKK